MTSMKYRFAELRPLIDALATERLVEFYNGLIGRGADFSAFATGRRYCRLHGGCSAAQQISLR